jgi:hypothetical protein
MPDMNKSLSLQFFMSCHSREGGNPERAASRSQHGTFSKQFSVWIPAFAGMTNDIREALRPSAKRVVIAKRRLSRVATSSSVTPLTETTPTLAKPCVLAQRRPSAKRVVLAKRRPSLGACSR